MYAAHLSVSRSAHLTARWRALSFAQSLICVIVMSLGLTSDTEHKCVKKAIAMYNLNFIGNIDGGSQHAQ